MKERLSILLISFACLWQQTIAQTPDSGAIDKKKKALVQASGLKRADLLNDISQAYFKMGFFGADAKARIDSMYQYAHLGHKEALQLNYKKGLTAAYLNLAISEICRYQYPAAEKNVTLALAGKDLDDNQLGLAYQFLHAIYYEGYQKVEEGMAYLKKSFRHYQKAGNEKEVGNAAALICQRYSGHGQYEEGLEYCKLSMKIFDRLASKTVDDNWLNIQVFRSLNNMIRVYKAAGDYSTALQYLHRLNHELKKRKGDYAFEYFAGQLHRLSKNYDSAQYYQQAYLARYPKNMGARLELGMTWVEQKRYDAALGMLRECLDSFRLRKEQARANLMYTCLYLGRLFRETGRPEDAKKILNEGLLTFTQSKRRLLPHVDQYEWQYQIHEYLGNSDSAYLYFRKYSQIQDSALSKQFIFQLNSYKKEAYDQQRETRIALLQKERELMGQQLLQQALLKEQKETQLLLLNRENKIKSQQLAQEAILQQQRDAQIALLDRNNRLKAGQLQQQAYQKKVLVAGLVVSAVLALLALAALSLQRKNEKLRRQQLEGALRMRQLESERKQAELQRQATELEMQALRAQMNPHFIFNSLNSIKSFVLKSEIDQASHYLTRFARLIRMVLLHSQNALVPLEDEVEMLRLYLDMEKLRFRNSFEYVFLMDESVQEESIFIPPLLLQPFCENAVWHGLMHKEGKGRLEVKLYVQEGMLHCVITDNGVGRRRAAELNSKSIEKDKSLGMKITTERLALLNENRDAKTFYEVEDVLDESGAVAGTCVHLRIHYKENAENPVTKVS